MYVRSNPAFPSKVKLPQNYSGSAFDRSGHYNDMPPPARQSLPKADVPSRVTDSSQDTYSNGERHSKVQAPSSVQADYRLDREMPYPDTQKREDEYGASDSYAPIREDHTHTEPHHQTPSIFSSLIPKGSLADHFPFGHGIGSEELLILGVMLLVYLSGVEQGTVDNEFIILLGLLLFAG